jgi:hypothetical protein
MTEIAREMLAAFRRLTQHAQKMSAAQRTDALLRGVGNTDAFPDDELLLVQAASIVELTKRSLHAGAALTRPSAVVVNALHFLDVNAETGQLLSLGCMRTVIFVELLRRFITFDGVELPLLSFQEVAAGQLARWAHLQLATQSSSFGVWFRKHQPALSLATEQLAFVVCREWSSAMRESPAKTRSSDRHDVSLTADESIIDALANWHPLAKR